MLDSAMPDLHRSWCKDRLKPRSQDHWTADGSVDCVSEEIDAGASWMFLMETGDGGVMLVLDGVEQQLPDAAANLASVSSAAIILAAMA